MDQRSELTNLIKTIGSQVTLDHVGRQNRPPEYRKKLPVDYLQIDKQFLRQRPAKQPILAPIRRLNGFSHQLGIKTIAAALESQELLEQIKSVGVNYLPKGIALPQLIHSSLAVNGNVW